ncbi:hypothetical protein EPA93_03680 [Ktedonosporobacter rubrisoli]|uniref:BD-FAE-like domain-containing protein n=1 Tax=Ktedonosporobacter rubrisoli TaxID=2509675 RepID=A0A4P6JJ62_KTERU|nr:prolyl oligopeptidase family serine peptidase [Ktedonosporobacter rubrisoli]QBD75144.1 hypothetical protein EPA93_03680 [Ktedonosporobacter rubrisoli]
MDENHQGQIKPGALDEDWNQASLVQAITHWFGPTDFVTMATRAPLEAHIVPPPFECALFGPGSDDEIAAKAPPFLIMHGDRDRMVPIADAEEFHAALSRCGAHSTFVSLGGAGHEG